MSSPSDGVAITPVTIGTAGHIDHGKTLLVECLTGMRADRPQERERGMTIDIGYAEMKGVGGRRIGFVDLPGHERFIRNMVAGATGVDLALLVVAADDGVMPQTREHLEILGLLGVRRGVVVLNKVDLVDEETRELGLEEIRDFLEGTALQDAPVHCCSASTGEGVEELRETLVALVEEVGGASDPGAFFMGIQRRFAAAGFGCIATGVPSSGTVEVGRELELLPTGKRCRVRAIEVYHEAAQKAWAGHRTALNLAGLHHEEVGRGMVVAEPGVFPPSRHVAARLELLSSCRRPLRHSAEVRFLSGTFEEMAQLYLTAGQSIAGGESMLVELRCAAPVCVQDGARFILRSSNSKETVGGGRVLRVLSEPLGRKNTALRADLEAWEQALPDPRARIRNILEQDQGGGIAELASRARLDKAATRELVRVLTEEGELQVLAGGRAVPAALVKGAAEGLREALASMHRERPLLQALPLAEVRDRAELTELLLAAALEALGEAVVQEGRTLRLADHEVRVDPATAAAADRVLAQLDRDRFAPTPRSKWAETLELPGGELDSAFALLLDRGQIREVAPDLYFPKALLDEGLRLLEAVSRKRGNFEPLEAKTAFGGISRKWLIPLLEFYDRSGATRRDGNSRILTRRGQALAQSGLDD